MKWCFLLQGNFKAASQSLRSSSSKRPPPHPQALLPGIFRNIQISYSGYSLKNLQTTISCYSEGLTS